jgi:hypothetical protein
VLASVSGEMAAVVIDHPDTGFQIAREFEGGDAGTKRGGSRRCAGDRRSSAAAGTGAQSARPSIAVVERAVLASAHRSAVA